jgi:hypothetical protein
MVVRWAAAAAAAAVGAYATYAALAWLRYGRSRPTGDPAASDPLLDRFMPEYEIAERHQVDVDAPADVTYEAARHIDFQRSPFIRAIFRSRELIMRSRETGVRAEGDFIEQMTRIGWGVLSEVPGRQVVMGAVTQPWLADVVFRPVPADRFAEFDEPDCVKIAWTLRADASGAERSIFRTETRAIATSDVARAKFRRYWALVSPGIILIRRLLLGPLKSDAERRARAQRHAGGPA